MQDSHAGMSPRSQSRGVQGQDLNLGLHGHRAPASPSGQLFKEDILPNVSRTFPHHPQPGHQLVSRKWCGGCFEPLFSHWCNEQIGTTSHLKPLFCPWISYAPFKAKFRCHILQAAFPEALLQDPATCLMFNMSTDSFARFPELYHPGLPYQARNSCWPSSVSFPSTSPTLKQFHFLPGILPF